MEINKMGNYFEDFVVGQQIFHAQSKTIFESDNNIFSLLTMNHHPVHTNLDYCENNLHGKILVPGTLVFCLSVHLLKNCHRNCRVVRKRHVTQIYSIRKRHFCF